MRTAQRGSIPIAWSLPIECHQRLVELARCRSDLFSASSSSRRARKLGVVRASSHVGLDAQVVWVEGNAARHDCPEDPGILVGERHHRLLPSRALA